MKRWLGVLAWAGWLGGLVCGCAGDEKDKETGSDEPWAIVASDLTEAVLSIHGTSSQDVWAVGANKGAGALVLHWDGSAWERMDTGHMHDLWWVYAVQDGPVFFAGADATILRYDGTAFERMAVPGVAKHTVFGVWARSADDAYAVGSVNGRDGFVWHWDGTAWTQEFLPSIPADENGNAPGFFKVWGDANDVWVVGSHGTLLRRPATGAWEVVPTSTEATLLTVHAANGRVAVVGGNGAAVILEGNDGAIASKPAEGAPTLQGLCLDERGGDWATGYLGVVLRRDGDAWVTVDTKLELDVESLHAVWVDPDGGVWCVGGNVLTPALDKGTIVHRGPAVEGYDVEGPSEEGGETPEVVCPEAQIDTAPPGSSAARRWNEAMLNGIRRAVPRPGVHARNLFHVSVASWDAWAAFEPTAVGYLYTDKHDAGDIEAAREEAISYAAYRVLSHRYTNENGGPVTLECYDALMDKMGYDPSMTSEEGDSPAAIGNRIGNAVIAAFAEDGANEAAKYADNTGYEFVNPPLVVDQPGAGDLVDPSQYQPLNLAVSVTQNGVVTDAGVQPYIGPHWRWVTPFALERSAPEAPYYDATPYPLFEHDTMVDWAVEVIAKQALLDPRLPETIDISPGAYGNNPLGSNDGEGHPENPATGQPYAPHVVPYGDFARVLAEFWADGPKSETPPGHWNTLANTISDSPLFERRLFGEGEPLDALEWDVKVYLALNGAVHDAAIAAWELKRLTNSSRPITIIRHMAELGQRTDTTLPNYDPLGLPLVEGLIEMITPESTAEGERHAHLAAYVGELALLGWHGEPGDRSTEIGGVGWMRALDWAPYQRRTFVTPAFPGFVSGHSTFSRAAAEALTELTGSAYFPGGLGEYVAKAGEYLVFEDGPSVEVRLQWATYYDAADQAGQSRIYGGIHITADDFMGRTIGSDIGMRAVEKAKTYYSAME